MVRLGVRGCNVKLRAAAQQLEQLRTAEDEPLPALAAGRLTG